MRFPTILLICALAAACSHISQSTESYEGIPATRFTYRNVVYRAYDVPASGMLLLSRSQESGSNVERHDIDAAARAYFAEIGRPQCLVLEIKDKGTEQWEIKYSCRLLQ